MAVHSQASHQYLSLTQRTCTAHKHTKLLCPHYHRDCFTYTEDNKSNCMRLITGLSMLPRYVWDNGKVQLELSCELFFFQNCLQHTNSLHFLVHISKFTIKIHKAVQKVESCTFPTITVEAYIVNYSLDTNRSKKMSGGPLLYFEIFFKGGGKRVGGEGGRGGEKGWGDTQRKNLGTRHKHRWLYFSYMRRKTLPHISVTTYSPSHFFHPFVVPVLILSLLPLLPPLPLPAPPPKKVRK